MKNIESGARTLLMSVVLSSPGPIVIGIGLFMGRSSTQLADFVRRSAELGAIIVSYFIYSALHKGEAEQDHDQELYRKAKLERTANICVGSAMCLSGLVILYIAIFGGTGDKGNVIPGLSIAFLGLVTNSWFWLRYAKLANINGDAVLAVQSRLYRAKSFVDACVFIVLLIVMIAPLSNAAHWADIGGSVIVSGYLIANGIIVLKNTWFLYKEQHQ
ncbi:MAG: cation transporter [Sedimentibacter sp.]|nr:cation transporter [Sedimentibacter sp.]